MILGITEFDEPEPEQISSTVPPPSRPSSALGGGVVTEEQPERAICRVVRCMTEYTCNRPHCAVCGGHFDPGKHTEATLCERCYDWQQVEARMTPEQRERLRQVLAGMPAFESVVRA